MISRDDILNLFQLISDEKKNEFSLKCKVFNINENIIEFMKDSTIDLIKDNYHYDELVYMIFKNYAKDLGLKLFELKYMVDHAESLNVLKFRDNLSMMFLIEALKLGSDFTNEKYNDVEGVVFVMICNQLKDDQDISHIDYTFYNTADKLSAYLSARSENT